MNTDDQTLDDASPTARRPGRARSIAETLLLLVLLCVLGGVIWLRYTVEGQQTWENLSYDAAAEQAAIAQLEKAGANVVAEPPHGHVTTVNFVALRDQPIGDDLVVPLTKCPWISTVNFSGTRLADDQMARLGRLSSLASLQLGGTSVTDAGLAHLKNLRNLTALHLVETQVSDGALAHLANLPSLAILDLRRSQVTDDGLKHLAPLRSLRHLLLSGERITDTGLRRLEALTELGRLTLEETATTPAGIGALRKAVPGLSVDLWNAPEQVASVTPPALQGDPRAETTADEFPPREPTLPADATGPADSAPAESPDMPPVGPGGAAADEDAIPEPPPLD